METDSSAAGGSDENVIVAVGTRNKYQLVALSETYRAQTALANAPEAAYRRSLDGTGTGDHGQVIVRVKSVAGDNRGYLFALGKVENIHDIHALCRSRRLGYLVALLDKQLSEVREHEQVIVAVRDKHILDIVLVARCHGGNSLAAAVLCLIKVDSHTLDIAGVCHGDNALVLLYEILKQYIVCLLDTGKSFVAELALYFQQIVAYDLIYLVDIR